MTMLPGLWPLSYTPSTLTQPFSLSIASGEVGRPQPTGRGSTLFLIKRQGLSRSEAFWAYVTSGPPASSPVALGLAAAVQRDSPHSPPQTGPVPDTHPTIIDTETPRHSDTVWDTYRPS